MIKTVKIGDQDVPMMAMASTDIYFNRIFHEDAIKIQTSNNVDEGDIILLFEKLGFVMAKHAELKDCKAMLALTEDQYIEWLEQFDHSDYIKAVMDIRSVYDGQKVGASRPKKAKGQ